MSNGPLMSIGAVARAVGLTEGTLRNWERRYGYPRPERTEGGHRVYGPEVVDFLSLVAKAIRQGHRPAQLLGMSKAQVEALMPSSGHILPIQGDRSTHQVEAVLRSAQSFDSDALFRRFRGDVASAGLLNFITTQAHELLTRIGQWWASGDLEIEHEHFATEVLRDFLSSEWRTLNADVQGPRVVCATPVGELHALGLHLVACCLVLNGYKVVFLGPDAPANAVAAAATEVDAVAVCLSMSMFSARDDNELMIERLHQLLPDSVELWVGGDGAEGLVASHTFRNFEAFTEFLVSRLPQMRAGDRQTP